MATIKLRDFICLMCFRTEIVVNYRNSQFYYNSADKKIKDVLNEREVQAFNILSNRIVIEVQ